MFLDHDVIQSVMSNTAGLVVVHADDDMIASGSVVYAVTIGLPVYGVETPHLKALQQELGEDSIKLAPDVRGSMDLISASNTDALARLDPRVVQQHFGDDHIRALFRRALFT